MSAHTMPPRELWLWQQALLAQPRVYHVVDSSGETTGNLYVSKEAAQIEVDWLKKRERRTYRVASLGNLHSVELSKERWEP